MSEDEGLVKLLKTSNHLALVFFFFFSRTFAASYTYRVIH